jgi:hypothetical protein
MSNLRAAVLCLFALLGRPVASGELPLTFGEPIAGDRAWVTPSRDGSAWIVCEPLKETRGQYRYTLLSGRGTDLRPLAETPIRWNDVIAAHLHPDIVSRDGSRIVLYSAVAAADPSDAKRSISFPRLAVADLKGGVVRPETKQHTTWFGTWSPVDDALYYIEAGEWKKTPGYAIRCWRPGPGTYETVYEHAEDFAFLLRISPDGKRLAFCSVSPKDRKNPEMRLRVLALDGRTAIDSEPFRVDDLFADGAPPMHWMADGRGLVFHRSPPGAPPPNSRERYQPWLFRPDTKAFERLTDDSHVAAIALLDARHVLLARDDSSDEPHAILRLADRKTMALPEGVTVCGGIGTRLAVYNPGTKRVHLADVKLPAE